MLLFLSNVMQTKYEQTLNRINCTFITHAHTQGKMYRHFRSNTTFFVPQSGKRWGNSVVYGSIFHIDDWPFHQRTLDAWHVCSLSSIGVNHKFDIHHRVIVTCTPINFATLDDFSRLLYTESGSITVQAYVGNPNHPKIKQRILGGTHSYRIVDGLDVESFVTCFREAQHC